MPMPSVEIAWGGGKWNGGHKKAVRPFVESALDMAREGIDAFGISVMLPKRAILWRASELYGDFGGANNATDFELYVSPKDLKRRKIAKRTSELTVIAFHELVHCVRNQHFDVCDLIELSAAEGLANTTENKFAGMLLPKEEQVISGLDMVGEHAVNAARLVNELFEDAEREVTAEPQQAKKLFDKWFDGEPGILTQGATIGVLAVQKLLAEGQTIPSVMTMPAEDILATIL